MMMGLNVRKVKLKAYVLDGFLCRRRRRAVLPEYAGRLRGAGKGL